MRRPAHAIVAGTIEQFPCRTLAAALIISGLQQVCMRPYLQHLLLQARRYQHFTTVAGDGSLPIDSHWYSCSVLRNTFAARLLSTDDRISH